LPLGTQMIARTRTPPPVLSLRSDDHDDPPSHDQAAMTTGRNGHVGNECPPGHDPTRRVGKITDQRTYTPLPCRRTSSPIASRADRAILTGVSEHSYCSANSLIFGSLSPDLSCPDSIWRRISSTIRREAGVSGISALPGRRTEIDIPSSRDQVLRILGSVLTMDPKDPTVTGTEPWSATRVPRSGGRHLTTGVGAGHRVTQGGGVMRQRIQRIRRAATRARRRLMRTRRGRWALGVVMLGLNVALGASVPLLLPMRWVDDL